MFEFLTSYARELILTIFSSFFPVSMQTAPFYMPSPLCQYFDSSKKPVYLNPERAM